MTTPVPCTRTDPHFPHEWFGLGQAGCPGVEPPGDVQDRARAAAKRALSQTLADVAATPDPRLDVVAGIVHENCLNRAHTTRRHADQAQRILDALDAMRPDEPPARKVYLAGWEQGHRAAEADAEDEPAPAGLSAAQEIRLRLAVASLSDRQVNEDRVAGEIRALEPWAAWVDHGPDETPNDDRTLAAARLAGDVVERAWKTERDRADLAEARLGHIADALRDYDGGVLMAAKFDAAVRDALAWTPDDTAPADTRDPHCIAQWPECVSGGYDPRCCRFPKSCSCESWDDTAPADAATGDGDGWHDWVSGSTDELPRDGITR